MIFKIMAAAMLLASCADAGCPPSGCGGPGDWEKSAQAFLNSDVPIVGVAMAGNVQTGSFKAGQPANGSVNAAGSSLAVGTDYVKPQFRKDLFLVPEFIQPLASVSSSDVVMDVSNRRSAGEAHIRGAIHVPSKSFLYENGTLRPVSEMAATLGRAGIAPEDRVVVYSDNFRSGEAAFVLWLLRYLGQEKVLALDGGLDEWTAASLPLETRENLRGSVNYAPRPRPDLLADYGYVKSGAAQAVDARAFQDFGKERIPGAFTIRPEEILDNGLVKAGARLNETFAKLDRGRPVVVYGDDLKDASQVWYALQLMGFDCRLYSWQDWQAHETSRIYEIK